MIWNFIEWNMQKSEIASMETNRASAVAMNAEVRRTKARLMNEVPKLRKLAMKKVNSYWILFMLHLKIYIYIYVEILKFYTLWNFSLRFMDFIIICVFFLFFFGGVGGVSIC